MLSHMYMLLKRSSRFLKQHLNYFLLSLLPYLLLKIHSIGSSLDGLIALKHFSKAIVGMLYIKSFKMELIAGVYGTIILTASIS